MKNSLPTLVFLITDQVPNNHPGHQISGPSGAMALLIILSYRELKIGYETKI